MSTTIPFTSNYRDVSTYEGYQYEFACMRCGNGHISQFRHSFTGFGGRLASIAGTVIGGEIGSRIETVGLMTEWNRSGTRGTTNDKRLLEASRDVADQFVQCPGCGTWVCRPVCWSAGRDRCATCADAHPEPAPIGLAVPPAPGRHRCSRCGSSGDGHFCGECGNPFARSTCSGCGSPLTGTRFCAECGTPTG